MKQNIDLNKMGMAPMTQHEVVESNGGRTTLAYDIGTFFRFTLQQVPSHTPQKNALTTLLNWFSQQ